MKIVGLILACIFIILSIIISIYVFILISNIIWETSISKITFKNSKNALISLIISFFICLIIGLIGVFMYNTL